MFVAIDDADGDCQWGEWSEWDKCSKKCGGGLRDRERYCDCPSPSGRVDKLDILISHQVMIH